MRLIARDRLGVVLFSGRWCGAVYTGADLTLCNGHGNYFCPNSSLRTVIVARKSQGLARAHSLWTSLKRRRSFYRTTISNYSLDGAAEKEKTNSNDKR